MYGDLLNRTSMGITYGMQIDWSWFNVDDKTLISNKMMNSKKTGDFSNQLEENEKVAKGKNKIKTLDASGDEVMINYKIYENGGYTSGEENLNTLDGEK